MTNRIANIIKDNIRTTQLIVDSTSPKDMYDMEAKWGFTSRGPVKGFKIHAVVNQLGLPLRAIVTPCNRFDSIFLPKLIEDLEADFVLADAGYHSLKNIEAVKARVLSQSLLSTHGRQGKEVKCQMQCSLGGRRWPVEQFNGHCKANLLRGCWIRPRGLVKKSAMVLKGLISTNINAIVALLEGNCGLKEASRYWD